MKSIHYVRVFSFIFITFCVSLTSSDSTTTEKVLRHRLRSRQPCMQPCVPGTGKGEHHRIHPIARSRRQKQKTCDHREGFRFASTEIAVSYCERLPQYAARFRILHSAEIDAEEPKTTSTYSSTSAAWEYSGTLNLDNITGGLVSVCSQRHRQRCNKVVAQKPPCNEHPRTN